MVKQDEIKACNIDNQDHTAWIVKSIEDASQQLPQLSPSTRIHRVPEKLLETTDYDKYYVPKVVSIGPYHHEKLKYELVELHKPGFMKELLSEYNVSLESLCQTLGEAIMVQDLRKFYEDKSTDYLPDQDFTRMMLLDGCFILYYIQFVYMEKRRTCGVLGSNHIVLIHEDLFLLENQIPYKLLNQVMSLINFDADVIESFITDSIFAQGRQKRGWFTFGSYSTQNDENDDHILHRLYYTLTQTSKVKTQKYRYYRRRMSTKTQKKDTSLETSERRTFHNVNELIDMGIHFKPSSTMYLANVEFVRRCWWFSADLKLPPITVDRLLNLLAYEMCLGDVHDDTWVISYVCLLDSLIDQPNDITALRNAGILDNPLGINAGDKEVANMFNEIGKDLLPNKLAYSKVKIQIQNHYDKWRSTHLAELKHDYLKSPWSLVALVGGILVLFLSGVQTYFTVWSPKSDCDELCKFLKMNHHL